MVSNNFIIKSNVNISNPVSYNILHSNLPTTIELNGFKNNLTGYLSYNGSHVIDTFDVVAGTTDFTYVVSDNVQYYNNYDFSIKIIEENTNINRTVQNLLSAGININSGNIEIYDSELVNVSWINNNFNGTNRVIFRNSSYTFMTN